MRLPAWARTDPAQVLAETVTENADGERVRTWAPTGDTVLGKRYPVSGRSLQRAQLLGVQVEWELHLDPYPLTPGRQRLLVRGVKHHIRDVRPYDGLQVLLLEEVTRESG